MDYGLILSEIFPSFISLVDLSLIVRLYQTTKNFQIQLKSPFILDIINTQLEFNVKTFETILNYYFIGLPTKEQIDKIGCVKGISPCDRWDHTSLKRRLLDYGSNGILGYDSIAITQNEKIVSNLSIGSSIQVGIIGRFDMHTCSSISLWSTLGLSIHNDVVELKLCHKYVKYYLSVVEWKYIKKEQKWFQEAPWLHLNGKTVEDAINILDELGW